jgi:hypothetical protein
MSLIKCTECDQDISTEAPICPHCGKPNTSVTPIQVEKIQSKGGSWKIAGYILLIAILFSGIYYFAFANQSDGTFIGKIAQDLNRGNIKNVFNDVLSDPKSNMQPSVQDQPDNHTQVALQEVKNLGYDFYVGEIESAGTTNINDDLKNQITKIAYTAQFSTSLLKDVPIIVLNNLALTGDQYISVPAGNLKVPDLKPDFLSEGGIYVTFTGGEAVIFINKPIIAQGQLTEVLTHELGHAVGSKLTDADWIKFYQLRNIPTDTVRHGTTWNLSPEEDFAEVYKNVFTGTPVRTYYGQLVPTFGDSDMGTCMTIFLNAQSSYMPQSQVYSSDPTAWLKSITSPTKIDYADVNAKANADPKVQSCRRDVMMNPSKYPSDWRYTTPYKSSVGPATKAFILSIADRLNQK